MIVRAAVAALAFAAPAQAAVPLSRVDDDARFALAGDTALFTRGGGREGGEDVRVLAAPVDGSAPPLMRLQVPVADNQNGDIQLGGSAQREAAVALVGREDLGTAQVYSGPSGGPLAPFGAPVASGQDAFIPYVPIVDGDHVLVIEAGDVEQIRYRIDGGPPFTLPGVILDFAGELIAYYEDTRGLVLRNWRTGAERAVAVPHPLEFLDLRADGAAVAQPETGGVLAISAAGKVTRVVRRGDMPRFAGNHIVYENNYGLMITEPGAKPRPFGPRTFSLSSFEADDRHVLWAAHGCLLSAPLDEPAASAPAAGPCPRTEVRVNPDDVKLRRDRRVPLYVRCFAAVRACRGSAHVFLDDGRRRSTSVRFSIPVGETRRLLPRLTPSAYRSARRGKDRDVLISVRGVVTDPDGRRQRLTGLYNATVR